MSRNFDFVEQPIPLITVNAERKLEVNSQALEVLANIEGPIAVVGVAGMYRTGKSYLLNRVILNRNAGFGVGPTINPCTKGIWMWGRPLKGQTADGEIVNVIVLDSEGLAAVDQDNSHDSRIFSLVMLLSSMFIYNSVGSIDEQALENLSLIVNLTRNIHVKSTGNEELDFEDFAYYMPSFLWVVRDFALELVDGSGESIDSKQYLESALQEQKGFSEQTEAKNHIRHLLRSFFNERACYTMVRPVTDEASLRQLDAADPESLRPEFVEQVLDLRKQILSHANKKLLNGSELSGAMLGGLVENYVRSINSNDVPNIESAWAYICKAQCTAAYEEAMAAYETQLQEQFMQVWPMSAAQLKGVQKECAEAALRQYKRKAVGDAAEDFANQLREEIKVKYTWAKNENAREFERVLMQELNNYYNSNIEPKLKGRQYGSFIDFERDLKAAEHYFAETEPQGPNKAQLIADFMQKKMTESIYVFIHAMESEHELALGRLKERKCSLEEELKALKERTARDKGAHDSRLHELEGANREMEARLGLLTESLERVKAERAKAEEAAAAQLSEVSAQGKETGERLVNENAALAESLKGLERELALKDSEFDKQMALLQQKVTFYEERLNAQSGKEEAQSGELARMKLEMNEKLRETTTTLEAQVIASNKELQRANERATDLEEELEAVNRKEKETAQAAAQRESRLKDELARKNEKLEEMEARLAETDGVSSGEAEALRSELESLRDTLEAERRAAQSADEKAAREKIDFEKKKAIFEQKSDFLQSTCDNLKKQLEESKNLYDETLKSVECSMDSEKMDLKQHLEDTTARHRAEIKGYELQLSNIKAQLGEEVARLTDALEDSERRAAAEAEALRGEAARYKDAHDAVERERLMARRELQLLEEQRDELERTGVERAGEKMRALEEELETLKEKYSRDMAAAQKKNEESYKQTKAFFDGEKERLERKLVTDKEAAEKKLSKQAADYEEQLREKEADHEEEIESIRNEFQEYFINNNSAQEHLKQSLFNAEAGAEELRLALEKINLEHEALKASYEANVDGVRATLEVERKQLIESLDRLRAEAVAKDKEVWNLTQKLESATAELAKVQESYNQRIKPLEEEANKARTQLDAAREKYNKLNDDYVDYKIEVGKKLALSQQQNEFLSRRVDELQKQTDSAGKRLEEKLREQREEHMGELAAVRGRAEEERRDAEAKYEAKRRAAKEAESLAAEKLGVLEKTKAELGEKLATLRSESTKNEARLAQENEALRIKLDAAQGKSETTLVELRRNVEALKEAKYKLELDLAEARASHEKEQALWEGQSTYEKERVESLERALEHEKKNFALMMQKMQKMRSSDKDDAVNSNTVLLNQMEQRHSAAMTEQAEKHAQTVQALTDRSTKLEREVKNLNEKLLAENNARLANYGNVDRKLNEAAENEKLLQEQIVKMRADREAKLAEASRRHEEAVAGYKSRLNEMDTRLQEMERFKANAMFEQERLKTKFAAEKESLNSQKDELLESLGALEKKKDTLLRENEKLKNDNRANRKLLGNNSTFQPNRFPNFLNSSKLADRSFVAQDGRQPSPINAQNMRDTQSKISFGDANVSVNSGQNANESGPRN